MTNVSLLLGKILTEVTVNDDSEIYFVTSDGLKYRMLHHNDCCESVWIEDICGDLQDLVGMPLVQACESAGIGPPLNHSDESYTWTFYLFATNRGSVTIRWYGVSNGYYSESVSFEEVNTAPKF